jgi:hypothetical protein
MERVCRFIQINKYTIIGNHAIIKHDFNDDECYHGGLHSVASHISDGLKYFLRDDVKNINVYVDCDINVPLVYFKYGMKEGNIMEIKDAHGMYFWLVKLFDIIL